MAAQFAGNGLGTANILCSAHLKLNFRFDEDALKNAWLHLRARFPQVASQTRPVVPADPIRMVEMLYRSPRSSIEAQEWVQDTVFNAPLPEAGERDVVGRFTSDISKLDSFDLTQLCWAAHLHFTRINDNEILLAIVCTHIASDGRQSMIYLDELIKAMLGSKALAQPRWGAEVDLLKLPLAMELGLRNEHSDHPPDMAEFLGSRAAFMPDVGAPLAISIFMLESKLTFVLPCRDLRDCLSARTRGYRQTQCQGTIVITTKKRLNYYDWLSSDVA